MELASVIKHTQTDDTSLSHKWADSEIRLGSQLIVGEGQKAFFVKGGEILDSFEAGTHTLSTGNLPLIDKLVKLPFDNKTPFPAEVWFVSTLSKRDLKWGTRAPIPILDKTLGFPVNVRSFGRWGIRIDNGQAFLKQFVGNQQHVDSEKIYEYLVGEIMQHLKDRISEVIAGGLSILEISTDLNEISTQVQEILSPVFKKYGLNLINFNIQSINLPDEEMAQIQAVFAKTLEANQLSKANVNQNYAAIKSFEIMGDAANNESDSGMSGLMQAGLGLGAGLPVGQQIGQSMNVQTGTENKESPNDPEVKLRKLKNLMDEGIISKKEYDAKRKQIIEEI